MSGMFDKLRKLRNVSFEEFKDRGRQGANILAERIGVSSQTKLPTDAGFFQKFDLNGTTVSSEALFEHFRSRPTVKFYASLEDRKATIAEFRRRFPNDEAGITERADRICIGFFDLLGYENLYFGNKVPNWHFEPVARKTSPRVHWSKIDEIDATQTGDKKIIWELNRHQYFATLGQAYWLTDDEKYAETFVAHLENWFENNPPKIGVNWLSSLEIAFRSISWIWAFHFFKDSPKFNSDVFVRMLKFLYLNGRHIETYLSTHFSPNTHLTGEALGLYFLGAFLPAFKDVERWKNLGYKTLMSALDFQVRPDGVYCEQSSHYHRYTTEFYTSLLILRRLEGAIIEQKHEEKLNQLFDFLLHVTQPNGETPHFGDDDGGRLYFLDESKFADFRPALALGAAVLNRRDLKFAAKDPTAELLWLLGVEGLRKFDELEAFEPNERSKAFKSSGFFTARDSWSSDANFILIDCGEHGFLNGGHAHADALGFVLSFGGEPVFVDSGTYNYTSEPDARDMFRSTASHNCLTVNGSSSSIPNGPFSWRSAAEARLLEWRDDEDSIYFRGIHNGFKRFGVDYEREIIFNKVGPVILTDTIKSLSVNLFELHFILSPRVEAEPENNSIRIVNGEKGVIMGINTEVAADDIVANGVWRIENCCISPRYGKKVESKKLIYSLSGKGSIQIRNVFADSRR